MKITKKVLEQYASVKKEIADLERLIEESKRKIRRYEREIVADTVTCSRDDLTIGHKKIEGIAQQLLDDEHERLKKRIEKQAYFRKKLHQVAVDVEMYIQSVDESEIRRILRMRYLEDLSWKGVAKNMGKGYTETSCRKKLERFLQKK